MMSATFQAIAWQIRSGPDHKRWETGDPYDFCCTGTPEADGMLHLYGAISWHDENHPSVRDVCREAKKLGFKSVRWERINTDTDASRAIVLEL